MLPYAQSVSRRTHLPPASIKQQVLDKLMVQLVPEAKAILTANLPSLAGWAQETLESLVSTAPNKASKPAS